MKAIFLLLFLLNSTPARAIQCTDWFKKNGEQIKIKYAQHFKAFKSKEIYLLQVGNETYLLKKPNEDFTDCTGSTVINFPVKRFVGMSTTYIPPLVLLGEESSLVAFSNIKYISNKKIRKNEILEIQYPPNPELVLKSKPDVVMAFVAESAKLEGIERLKNLNVPVVLNGDFLEKNPLARAEWIKFFGFLYDKEKIANKIFNDIEKRFNALKEKVSRQVKKRPTILVGKNVNGIWRGPGGNSDFVKLINIAGADYLFAKKKNVSLSIEEVLKNLTKVDFWLPQNTWVSLDQIITEDKRYKTFPFVIKKNVYNSTKSVTKTGGNDFWETAFMRPDLLLKDLVKIFHPQLVPQHQMRWFKKLDYVK